MKAIIQKKQVGCEGCVFDGPGQLCGLDSSYGTDDHFDCRKHKCIYVLADVEPVNKESES